MDSASVQPRANTACYVLFRLMACSNLLRVVCYPKGEEMSSQQRKESSAGSGSCGQAASAALNSRARGCKGSDGGTPKCPRGAAAGTPSVLHGSGAPAPLGAREQVQEDRLSPGQNEAIAAPASPLPMDRDTGTTPEPCVPSCDLGHAIHPGPFRHTVVQFSLGGFYFIRCGARKW